MRSLYLALSASVVFGLGAVLWISISTQPVGAARAEDGPLLERTQDQPTGGGPAGLGAGGQEPDRSRFPDSFRYYGPNGLWNTWNDDQKIGRNTWQFYTAGNQKFYHILAKFAGGFDISVNFYRLLDSKERPDRFRKVGVINEPNFVQAGAGGNR